MWDLKRISVGRTRAELKGKYRYMHIIYMSSFLPLYFSIFVWLWKYSGDREKRAVRKRKTVMAERAPLINKPYRTLDNLRRCLR